MDVETIRVYNSVGRDSCAAKIGVVSCLWYGRYVVHYSNQICVAPGILERQSEAKRFNVSYRGCNLKAYSESVSFRLSVDTDFCCCFAPCALS